MAEFSTTTVLMTKQKEKKFNSLMNPKYVQNYLFFVCTMTKKLNIYFCILIFHTFLVICFLPV